MTADPFELRSPAPPGEGVPWEEHQGALLLVEVDGFEPGITTVHGVSDAVRCTVHVVDGPGAEKTYENALIFPKVLVSQLRREDKGARVVARLGQGAKQPGKSAPWQLMPVQAQELEQVRKWLQDRLTSVTTPDAPPF